MSTVYVNGFGRTEQNPEWQPDEDGIPFAVLAKTTDTKNGVLSLVDYLESGETIDTAEFADSGATTSDRVTDVATARVTFTITGVGETEVTVTTSNGRIVTQCFRTLLAQTGARRTDYGR